MPAIPAQIHDIDMRRFFLKRNEEMNINYGLFKNENGRHIHLSDSGNAVFKHVTEAALNGITDLARNSIADMIENAADKRHAVPRHGVSGSGGPHVENDGSGNNRPQFFRLERNRYRRSKQREHSQRTRIYQK